MDLGLLDFLYGEGVDCLLWIDFKDIRDFRPVEEQVVRSFPRAKLRCAPRAMWGGPSIAGSMLAALAFAAIEAPDWTQVVFCSILDVPLAPQLEIVSTLDELIAYDYCGSRWNKHTHEVLKPFDSIPVVELPIGDREYDRYKIRPEMAIGIEKALSGLFAPDQVRQLRLCNNVYERYFVGISEDFVTASLLIHRMTKGRARERYSFFTDFGLVVGRQWMVCSRRFADRIITDRYIGIYNDWFSDVLIADECFFQTVAARLAATGDIEVLWRNIYFSDAAVLGINSTTLSGIRQRRDRLELFGRKRVGTLDYTALLK